MTDAPQTPQLQPPGTPQVADIFNALQQLNVPPATPTDTSAAQNGSQTQQDTEQMTVDPPSEWELLHTQLAEKAHDPEGWNNFINMAEGSGDLDKIKEAYEALLKMYPNTVSEAFVRVLHRLML